MWEPIHRNVYGADESKTEAAKWLAAYVERCDSSSVRHCSASAPVPASAGHA
jgi:hypothetical protein